MREYSSNVVHPAMLQAVANQVGTPCYLYCLDAIRQRVRELRQAFGDRFQIRYAVKSNPNPALIRYLRDLIDSLDVSSIGEVRSALDNGWSPQQLSFTGPAKRREDLAEAISSGIGNVVVESVEEAWQLNELAGNAGIRQPVVIRITPDKVPRGFGVRLAGRPTQFGIDEEKLSDALPKILGLPHLDVSGMHCFAGSQCLDEKSIAAAYEVYHQIFRATSETFDLQPRTLIFGAGLGVATHEDDSPLDLNKLAQMIIGPLDTLRNEARFRDTKFVLELGRYLVAEAGFFLTRILRVKSSRGSLIGMCDGGMNHHLAASGQFGSILPRNYRMTNTSQPGHSERKVSCDLVGPLCTSIDRLAHAIEFPRLEVGDVIAVHASGAYGLTASPMHFIGHDPPREVTVERIENMLRLSDVSQFRERSTSERFLVDATLTEKSRRAG